MWLTLTSFPQCALKLFCLMVGVNLSGYLPSGFVIAGPERLTVFVTWMGIAMPGRDTSLALLSSEISDSQFRFYPIGTV